jgi:uncharacterized protein YcbX
MAAIVTSLSVTPVKGTRLHTVDELELGPHGVDENRRFYVIDARDRMVNAKVHGALTTIVADYSAAERRLKVAFPDGQVVEGVVRTGDQVRTKFYSSTATGQLVEGPWSAAISEHVGIPLRLVEAGEDGAVDRGEDGTVSVISRASLQKLAQEGGVDDVDVRRFRMLIEVDGVAAHEEDGWVGRRVRIGEAVLALQGHVGRCLITSRQPDTGVIDLPTLDILRGYRSHEQTTEPLPFGVYGAVESPGRVRRGDPVALAGVAASTGT